MKGGNNTYAYVVNSPINHFDPKGLQASPFDPHDGCPIGWEFSAGECWPSTQQINDGCIDDGLGSCVVPSNSSNSYCAYYSTAISVCADAASIGAVAAAASTGGVATPGAAVVGFTAQVVSVSNGIATFLVCGPKPSVVTSTVGTAAPGWYGAAVSAIDAALSIAGY